MDILSNLAMGFEVALTWQNLFYCLLGVSLGMLIGVLPGVGHLAAISMLLPLTFYVPPTTALVLLAGIYYGAQYGGSTASILLNLPGTPASAVVCLDGYPMAKEGRAGVALFMTAIASFFGSIFAIVLLVAFAPPLAKVALNFGAAEYFSMMVLGLVAASILVQGSALKGIASVLIGLVLGLVGTDVTSGMQRFTFDITYVYDGISIVALAMGIFGITEVISNVGKVDSKGLSNQKISYRSLLPTGKDIKESIMPMFRGSALGSAVGILPGAGVSIASFMSYALEKRVSKHPEKFGKGAIEGITAPESANNASAQSAFIPTLTLGIPGDAVMALMLGALLIHGIAPGPTIISETPEIFWGLVASFLIGNILLLVLNIPLIGVWVSILKIPYTVLYPSIILFIAIGVYSINYSYFDIMLVALFGFSGYMLYLLKFEPAPMLLGFILGPLIEENFRRTLLISRGDLMFFIERPISAAFLAITLLLIASTLFKAWQNNTRKQQQPAEAP
ncbi:tripartite tricarboxylate transporter permease [Nitrincola sp.]|uniref:tripartite tricarboxylate transporter permease n=1 Tax=Nitrincola sp. TaxID=1926584 RepID=UPI003A95867E